MTTVEIYHNITKDDNGRDAIFTRGNGYQFGDKMKKVFNYIDHAKDLYQILDNAFAMGNVNVSTVSKDTQENYSSNVSRVLYVGDLIHINGEEFYSVDSVGFSRLIMVKGEKILPDENGNLA